MATNWYIMKQNLKMNFSTKINLTFHFVRWQNSHE